MKATNRHVLTLGLASLCAFAHSSFAQSVGDQYNAEWKLQHGQQSKKGVSVYTGHDQVFVNNGRRFGTNPFFANTAIDFLDHLEQYSAQNACIPKITFAGHGWSNADGGAGLPMGQTGAGLYTNSNDRRYYGRFSGFAFFRTSSARTLKDFERLVQRKKINFCDRCLVQVHSCNIEDEFGMRFAKASGCQVVTSAGKVYPVDTRDGSLDHVWISGVDESGSYSGFNRFTPTGRTVITEQIGSQYIGQ